MKKNKRQFGCTNCRCHFIEISDKKILKAFNHLTKRCLCGHMAFVPIESMVEYRKKYPTSAQFCTWVVWGKKAKKDLSKELEKNKARRFDPSKVESIIPGNYEKETNKNQTT